MYVAHSAELWTAGAMLLLPQALYHVQQTRSDGHIAHASSGCGNRWRWLPEEQARGSMSRANIDTL